MLLNTDILDKRSNIPSGCVLLLPVELCIEQGTGAVLLRQTAAVLHSFSKE